MRKALLKYKTLHFPLPGTRGPLGAKFITHFWVQPQWASMAPRSPGGGGSLHGLS